MRMLQEDELRDAALLVFANKQVRAKHNRILQNGRTSQGSCKTSH